MVEKSTRASISVHGVGVATAIGAAVFVLTREPVWIAIGVGIGAALDWERSKSQRKRL